MESWQYWLVIGIVVLISEIFLPGFVLGSIGIGALITAPFALLGLSMQIQIIIFCIASIVVFFVIRPFANKFLYNKENARETGVNDLVGKSGEVTEVIDNSTQSGRIKIYGESWKARSENNERLDVEQIVIVKKVEGLTLIVDKRIDEV